MRTGITAATLLLLTPFIASAAPRTFHELANTLVTIIDTATALLIVAAIVIYFFGISTGLMGKGEDGNSKLRTQIMWGLVTIFLIVSIWGILRLIQSTLFMGDPSSSESGQQADSDPFNAPTFSE